MLKSAGCVGSQSSTDRWSGKQVASAKQSGKILLPKKKKKSWGVTEILVGDQLEENALKHLAYTCTPQFPDRI